MLTLGRVRRESSLAAQFLVLQLAVIGLLLVIVAALSIRQSTAEFTTQRGAQMRSVAEYVANLGVVREGLVDALDGQVGADQSASTLAPMVDRGVSLSGASDVLLVGLDGTILASSDPSRVGEEAELGESDALKGRGWSGAVATGEIRAVAAHAPVFSEEPKPKLIGLVVAEQTYPSVWERMTSAAPDLGVFLGLGALLGLCGAYVVSRVVKRSTRGLSPRQLATLADHREALLHAIREGVVAVGTDGRVTMMNDAARSTLGLDKAGMPDPVGRRIDNLGLDPHAVALLSGMSEGRETRDAVALVGTRAVVFNRREASTRGHDIGSVTTLRDRTELLSLQAQLSSNLTITDTLRAQTHEFDNRLHTISGLIELGQYDDVVSLVGTLSRRRSDVTDFVTARLLDPAVAALVVAKRSVADERGVRLVLDPGSRLPVLHSSESGDLTAIVGNLVDNAVDACAGLPERTVELWIFIDEQAVHVRVRDDGPGVPEELREAVFVRGYTTKPGVLGGRGVGLPLVRLICGQRGGSVELFDGDRGGAEFHVVLPIATLVDESNDLTEKSVSG